MALIEYLHQLLSVYVGANLRLVETNMPEQFLNKEDICTVVQHACFAAMTQLVRNNLRQPGTNSKNLNKPRNSTGA
jgi:hypothetical protein